MGRTTPITTILEVFYLFFYKLLNNSALSIIGLSFVITILTLPLYLKAEKLQDEARNITNKLKNNVKRIKLAFKGDEQYMILRTYYKQNHYHPIMGLRSSFSLLIQIPFFMGAYNFISNLNSLNGQSFLFIKDFSKADALFSIGTITINILPITMTLINLISGLIYSKGQPMKEKIQIFVCPLIFLALLYNSPSALVLYWTMNNIFSLLKNIFLKFKNPKKIAYIFMCILCSLGLFASIFLLTNTKMIFRLTLIVLTLILPIAPFILIYFSNIIHRHFVILDNTSKKRISINQSINYKTNLFLTAAIIITLIAGLYIPSTLIESETSQFCYVDSYSSPFYFLFNTFFQAIGFFLFWPCCLYFLFSDKIKKIFAVLYPPIAFSALINVIFFGGNYGPLQQDLLFMIPQRFWPSKLEFILNLIIIIAVFVLVFFILSKQKIAILKCVNSVVLLSLSMFILFSCFKINKTYKSLSKPIVEEDIKPILHLSKDKKNVILIMQDRLFIPYVDYIFNNYDDIKSNYSGFTFYKNCISFGPLTMIGTPCLYGGYDFTPFEINKRTNQILQEKHNQALLTLPVLFLNNNFNVSVSDLAYENYLEYPVTNMYKDYPKIQRNNLKGVYSDLWYKQNNIDKQPYFSSAIKRNLIWFSLFKIVPPILRTGVYGRDYWKTSNYSSENFTTLIDSYSSLDYLPELIDFSSENSSLIVIENELTHDGAILQTPNYIPSMNIDNSDTSEPLISNSDFHTQIAALLRISELITYLKANNVYDNTKIIIVSDHGIPVKLPRYFENSNNLPFSTARSTATLLVKDFNSNFDFEFNMDFMTNADVPFLATKDIIENAKNPFTNNPLKVNNKNDYVKISFANAESTRIRKNSQFSIKDDEWATVIDNIYIDDNWSLYTK